MNDRELLLYNTLKSVHSLARAPKAEVARDLCGLQAQFSRNPQISLRLRASDYSDADWDDGLVKIWSHRSTIHMVRREELGLYLSAAGQNGPFQEYCWFGMTGGEQSRWAPFIQEQIALGNDTRDGLKRACMQAGMSEELVHKAFYGWGGLIKEMAWRGMLVCGTGTDKRYALPGEIEWMDRNDARRILVRRYFETFGPATRQDCRAFFGYPARELDPILKEVLPELIETPLGGARYYHARPLEEGEIPPCVLLPGFDQTVMAYRDRDRLVDAAHLRKVVNAAGIVFPVAVLRGRARARWKLDGEKILVTPFERLLKKDEAALKRAARRELNVRQVEFAEDSASPPAHPSATEAVLRADAADEY